MKGASEQLTDLIAYVDGDHARAGGKPAQQAANALASVNNGETQVACNQLQAFLNKVKAQTGKKLTSGQADYLTTTANRIRAVLGC